MDIEGKLIEMRCGKDNLMLRRKNRSWFSLGGVSKFGANGYNPNCKHKPSFCILKTYNTLKYVNNITIIDFNQHTSAWR